MVPLSRATTAAAPAAVLVPLGYEGVGTGLLGGGQCHRIRANRLAALVRESRNPVAVNMSPPLIPTGSHRARVHDNTQRPRPKHRTRKGPRLLDSGPFLYTVLGAVLELGANVVLHLTGFS